MKHVTTDVAVVGAGPAGSVFATRMAQLGFDVCLIERARFPRPHLGEALTPGVMPMLASIGSDSAVAAAGFQRVSAVSTNWDGHEAVRHDPRAEGILVDRGAFDAALADRAAAARVRVLQPAHVRDYVQTREGWQLNVDAEGASIGLQSTFVADATGRSAALGGRRRRAGPRTIAVYAYWTGTRLPSRPRIEAGEREWFWGVPIPDGSYNTLVFVDAGRFRTQRATTLDERLRALLARSALMRDAVDAKLRAPARAADATPYVDEECVGDCYIRIGDAALALDPLSSSGVQTAIRTALSGAIVVNTLLRQPGLREAARRFYRDSVTEAAARHRSWAAGHYATVARHCSDPFWTERAADADPTVLAPVPAPMIADDVPVRVSPETEWNEVPCLGEQYVEMRFALRHPRLDGPIAYVGGEEVGPLLRGVKQGMTSRQLAQAWSRSMPIGKGLSIARWLSSHGVLEPSPMVRP
jgi:flavin-dependent dehydrogenase